MISLVIHGHFYQPPRENPWTGFVEREAGAQPFHDWNERIHAECYRANAFARIHDRHGRVASIANNYSRLSFNFGPTLVGWLARHHPRTWRRIVDADRGSVRRLGHGNAIAQAYGHPILPLASPRDLRTQIKWGLADFRARFGREAEALWLPETACNESVLEALMDEGLRYAILAPHQAASVREIAEVRGPTANARRGTSEEAPGSVSPKASNERLDTSRPYFFRHRQDPKRSIALFFYDGELAKGVAFEGALASSARLVDRFERAAKANGRGNEGAGLVHFATDGESYGHHSRFGDRCLAFTLAVEAPRRGFRVTNYAEFLDRVEPTHEVLLSEGADGLGTSWSCAHGIERWRSDCGCQTGGKDDWSQAWRVPLREALTFLRDEAARLFEDAGADLFKDPWAARDAYGALLAARNGPTEEVGGNEADPLVFLRSQAKKPLSARDSERALGLLELARHALLTDTSCGYFFSDISGLESVQILKYGGRVLDSLAELGQEPRTDRFLEILAEARSNLPAMGNGADVYHKLVEPCRVTPASVAAHLAMTKLVDHLPDEGRLAGFSFAFHGVRREKRERLRAATGRLRLADLATTRPLEFAVGTMHLGGVDFHVVLKEDPGEEEFAKSTDRFWKRFTAASLPAVLRALDEEFDDPKYGAFGLAHVLSEGRREIFDRVFGDLVERFSDQFAHLYDDNRRLLDVFTSAGFEIPQVLKAAAEFTLSKRFLAEIERQNGSHDRKRYEEAIRIAAEAARHGYDLDRREAKERISKIVLSAVQEAIETNLLEEAEEVVGLVELARLLGLSPDFEEPQEALFEAISTMEPAAGLRRAGEALGLGLPED